MRSQLAAFVIIVMGAAPLAAQETGGQQQQGQGNPRLLPDISVVGDFIGDFSPDGSTQEDGRRLGVREVELAFQAAVDPYFRGDVYLGLSDLEGIAIEQAVLTTSALPWQLEARLGRFLMPVGKQNLTHRHDLHTIEYPYVIQRFLGEEGLKGTGVSVSRIFAPLGFFQELIVSAVDAVGGEEEGDPIVLEEPINRKLSGLGYQARLRNYWDLSESSNLEVSGSMLTGKRAQPFADDAEPEAISGVAARQTVVSADVTYRWRPLQQGLYKSFIVQAEVMRQLNDVPDVPAGQVFGGPDRGFTGAYAFARYQITRRAYLGSRFDWVQDPEAAGGTLTAVSGYLEVFPSEFSKLMAAYERVNPDDGSGLNRILLQATFALGPHRPHPF
ncbi:MAG: hypothetical protein WEF86_16225 [Gemmatimonadota bacterium]